MRRAAASLLAAALLLGWAAALLFPLPASVGALREEYLCRWETGEQALDYAAAYAALVGAGEEGVLLEQGGVQGTIPPTQAYRALLPMLEEGALAQLLSLSGQGLSRIERAAVWRTYSARLWNADGEWFSWTGNAVARTQLSARPYADTLTLFSDPPAAQVLAQLGTQRLVFRDAGTLTAHDLVGTRVSSVSLPAPYAFSQGVLTLDTAGGRRIVCGMPVATALVLPSAAFADEGALLACSALEEVTVPFAGSSAGGAGSDFRGEFAHLFSDNGRYCVPETLKRVTVTGGVLVAYAFYACSAVEEITACGVDAQDIARQAFLGAPALRTLHTPRRDVALSGEYAARTLACGCTLYTRD